MIHVPGRTKENGVSSGSYPLKNVVTVVCVEKTVLHKVCMYVDKDREGEQTMGNNWLVRMFGVLRLFCYDNVHLRAY